MVQNVSLPPLSKRGLHNAQVVEGRLGDLIDLFRNQYDQEVSSILCAFDAELVLTDPDPLAD